MPEVGLTFLSDICVNRRSVPAGSLNMSAAGVVVCFSASSPSSIGAWGQKPSEPGQWFLPLVRAVISIFRTHIDRLQS